MVGRKGGWNGWWLLLPSHAIRTPWHVGSYLSSLCQDRRSGGDTQAAAARDKERGSKRKIDCPPPPVAPAHIARRKSRIYGARGSNAERWVPRWVGVCSPKHRYPSRPRKPPPGCGRATPLPRLQAMSLSTRPPMRERGGVVVRRVGGTETGQGGSCHGGARQENPHHHQTRAQR